MVVTIQNEHLAIDIAVKGAELQRVISTDNGINYMWSGDADFWGKFSPVLFPIVGALKDNTYIYQGQKYTLPRHGFARDMIFDCQQISSTEAVFTLKHSEQTLAIYPFEFELKLIYQLHGTSLTCTYQVSNPSDKEMLFSVGGHPAFAAPLNNEGIYTDYYLQFNNDDELTYHHIENNLISDKTTTLKLEDKILHLQHELFYEDALVFKHLKSNNIKLLNNKNDSGINFHFENFPYFGIWAAKDANFVCLEPWCGIADGINHNQQLEEKEGMEKLGGGGIWKRSWEISCF